MVSSMRKSEQMALVPCEAVRNLSAELQESRTRWEVQKQRCEEATLLLQQVTQEEEKVRAVVDYARLKVLKQVKAQQEIVKHNASRSKFDEALICALQENIQLKKQELRRHQQLRWRGPATAGERAHHRQQAAQAQEAMAELQHRQRVVREELQMMIEDAHGAAQRVEDAKAYVEVLEAQRAPTLATLGARKQCQQQAVHKEQVLEQTLREQQCKLQEEHTRGFAVCTRARLLRRAQLPEKALAGSRRAAHVAKFINMDWCVTSAAAEPGRQISLGVAEFLQSPEGQVLQNTNIAGDCLFWFETRRGLPGRYIILSRQLLHDITGPKVKRPPPQLNFFELLRSSLGDPQFTDVVLVPEAPHFHEKALGLDCLKNLEVPTCLKDKLRPYQVAGFRWLACLAHNGLGAVLADDMGLGKTLQSIALLIYMKEQGLLRDERGQLRPALVVVPPGLLRNWQAEFAKWAPQLNFFVYHGPQRALPPFHAAGYDIILTTYEMVRNDRRKLCDVDIISFSAMIIDEAQRIKNHNILVTKAVKEVGNIIGHTRIALSGTPIENKVDELHSIFDFANFGYLGDQVSFSRTFSRIIEKGRDPEQRKESLDLLYRLTRPFQMRRLKTDESPGQETHRSLALFGTHHTGFTLLSLGLKLGTGLSLLKGFPSQFPVAPCFARVRSNTGTASDKPTKAPPFSSVGFPVSLASPTSIPCFLCPPCRLEALDRAEWTSLPFGACLVEHPRSLAFP
ncbi:unnamed protein product [Effrenium voratum]|nr:unnamed protein product [Effrenium voratum]